MLSNFKTRIKAHIRLIATVAAILASLTVAANNTAQFLNQIRSHPTSVERSLPLGENAFDSESSKKS